MLTGAAIVLIGGTEAILAHLRAPDQSLLGAEPQGRVLTYREYPVGGRFWTQPSSPHHVYPGGLEARRYWVDIDGNGFLAPSRVHEHADLEIVFLGGSTTEGLFVTPDRRFPYLVGRQLEDSLGIPVNTYNGGRSGNVSMHAVLSFLAKVAPMHPKYVVLMENINDLAVLSHLGGYWNPDSPRPFLVEPSHAWQGETGGPLRRMKDALKAVLPNTYDVLWSTWNRLKGAKSSPDEFAAVRGKEPPYDQARVEASFRQSVETFVAVARIWQSTPVLMTQANRFLVQPDTEIAATWDPKIQGVEYGEFRRRYERFNAMIRKIAAEQKVPLIDLAHELSPGRLDMYDAVHFTDLGSERAAAVISRAFLALERSGPASSASAPRRQP